MSQDDPDDPARADPKDVFDVEPPVTLSEALGDETSAALSELPGIGEVFAARLHRSGVTGREEVAAMDAAELAAVLETSRGRAANILEAAQSIRSSSSDSRSS